MKSLERKLLEKGLRSLDLFTLEKRKQRGDFIAVFNTLMKEEEGQVLVSSLL